MAKISLVDDGDGGGMTDETREKIEQYIDLSMEIIAAMGAYAAEGEYNDEADGAIKQMKVAVAAVQGALNTGNIMAPPSPPVMPPIEPEGAGDAARRAASMRPPPPMTASAPLRHPTTPTPTPHPGPTEPTPSG